MRFIRFAIDQIRKWIYSVLECCDRIRKTFVQGESRSQVYLDYAEPPPKVHLYERIDNGK